MKRVRGIGEDKQHSSKKGNIVYSSYLGLLKDGKRDGVHKIIISGNCKTICMICPFVNGIKEGESYSFYEESGKLINYSLFRDNQVVEQFDLSIIDTSVGILDFEDGSRWEGEICHDRSSGRGKFFSPDNYVIYEGMSVNNKREGHGVSYYEVVDNNGKPLIEYDGDWIYNKMSGLGRLFDRKGNCVIKGQWLNGELMKTSYEVKPSDCPLQLHTRVEELILQSNCLNSLTSFDINKLESLQLFKTGDCCLQKLHSIAIVNHRSLKVFEVGDCCFCEVYLLQDIRKNEKELRNQCKQVRFAHNRILNSIRIGNNSFVDYCKLSIEGRLSLLFSIACPQLQRLQIGKMDRTNSKSYNFYFVPSLIIQNLPSLVEVKLSHGCFFSVSSVIFQNLPELISLHFGNSCCYGDDLSDKTLNHVQFRNLPSLSILTAQEKAFFTFIHISLDNLPCLSDSSSIRLQQSSFNFINKIITGAYVPKEFPNKLSTTYVKYV